MKGGSNSREKGTIVASSGDVRKLGLETKLFDSM